MHVTQTPTNSDVTSYQSSHSHCHKRDPEGPRKPTQAHESQPAVAAAAGGEGSRRDTSRALGMFSLDFFLFYSTNIYTHVSRRQHPLLAHQNLILDPPGPVYTPSRASQPTRTRFGPTGTCLHPQPSFSPTNAHLHPPAQTSTRFRLRSPLSTHQNPVRLPQLPTFVTRTRLHPQPRVSTHQHPFWTHRDLFAPPTLIFTHQHSFPVTDTPFHPPEPRQSPTTANPGQQMPTQVHDNHADQHQVI